MEYTFKDSKPLDHSLTGHIKGGTDKYDMQLTIYPLPYGFIDTHRPEIEDHLKKNSGKFARYVIHHNEISIFNLAESDRSAILLPIVQHLEQQDRTTYIIHVLRRRRISL